MRPGALPTIPVPPALLDWASSSRGLRCRPCLSAGAACARLPCHAPTMDRNRLLPLAAGLMWAWCSIVPPVAAGVPGGIAVPAAIWPFGRSALLLAWLDHAAFSHADACRLIEAEAGGHRQHRSLPVRPAPSSALAGAAADDDHRHAAGGHCAAACASFIAPC